MSEGMNEGVWLQMWSDLKLAFFLVFWPFFLILNILKIGREQD